MYQKAPVTTDFQRVLPELDRKDLTRGSDYRRLLRNLAFVSADTENKAIKTGDN